LYKSFSLKSDTSNPVGNEVKFCFAELAQVFGRGVAIEGIDVDEAGADPLEPLDPSVHFLGRIISAANY